MRKLKAFTLVELLVVISIIAMLLAILIPSLQKAREVAQRVICSNHERTFALANAAYAAQSNGAYVPVRSMAGAWPSNKTFRNLLDFDKYLKEEDKVLQAGKKVTADFDLPNTFLCPSDKIGNNYKNRYTYADSGSPSNVLLSYGYNFTEWAKSGQWSDWQGKPADAGHKASNIKLPASKLAFIDSIDWWVCWVGADYENAWDILGQACISDYRQEGVAKNPRRSLLPAKVYGPVMFRHSEGAVVGFYDGHCKYMRKQEIYVKADREYITIGEQRTRKNPGMWVSDYALYIANKAP
jgi:prepilin-type N-terminal cleavage/methylation domain-containing protein/prepilin-type processing-associated H-X9-DG protein